MKLFPIASVILAMLMVSCASYTSIAPSVLMDLHPGTSQVILPGDIIRLTLKHGKIMSNLKVMDLDSGKIKVLQDRPGSGGQWIHFTETISITDIKAVQKSAEPTLAEGGIFLIAENSITHQYYFFRPGQTVRYKIRSSRGFTKGRIAGFTDSTISFQNRKAVNVNHLNSALATIIIPRSPGRTLRGAALMTVGICGLAVGSLLAVAPPFGDDKTQSAGAGAAVLGFVALVGGIPLVKHKKIDLETSWKLKTIKLQDQKLLTLLK